MAPPVDGPKDSWPHVFSLVLSFCWRPHLAGTRQYIYILELKSNLNMHISLIVSVHSLFQVLELILVFKVSGVEHVERVNIVHISLLLFSHLV